MMKPSFGILPVGKGWVITRKQRTEVDAPVATIPPNLISVKDVWYRIDTAYYTADDTPKFKFNSSMRCAKVFKFKTLAKLRLRKLNNVK
jgi:hypothetical protein